MFRNEFVSRALLPVVTGDPYLADTSVLRNTVNTE